MSTSREHEDGPASPSNPTIAGQESNNVPAALAPPAVEMDMDGIPNPTPGVPATAAHGEMQVDAPERAALAVAVADPSQPGVALGSSADASLRLGSVGAAGGVGLGEGKEESGHEHGAIRVFNPVPPKPRPEPESQSQIQTQTQTQASGSGSSEPNETPKHDGSASAPLVTTTSAGGTRTGAGRGTDTPDEAFFEPTLADVQAHHASVVARNKRLNEAPLLTAKYREEEREARERRKADKWPTTTIRIKFSDGTQIQSTFPSTSPIQAVYAFVREALDAAVREKAFTLWQPPRFSYPEHPPVAPAGSKPKPKPKAVGGHIVTASNYGLVKGGAAPGLTGGSGGRETLSDLGLVPQSVLLVKWEEEGMNASGHPAPILPELKQKAEPLPTPQLPQAQVVSTGSKPSAGGSDASGQPQKKIPKWLAKGLMKKK